MVTTVTSLSRSGLSDWLIQRVSGVVLFAYAAFLIFYIASCDNLTFAVWSALFDTTPMRVFSSLAVICLVAHAWIGMWAVSTDYLTERMMGSKGDLLRGIFQAVCALMSFTYLVWGLQVVWS